MDETSEANETQANEADGAEKSSGLDETDGAKIGQLVSLLQSSKPVEWERVKEYVSGYPGWLYITTMMRYPSQNVDRRLMPREREAELWFVSNYSREKLLEIFQPYALLLDPTRTPSERARALQEAGYDTVAFCKENQSNGSREIAAAAREALAACRAQKNLLRGSARPNDSAEALRPALTGTERDDSLVTPSEAPPNPEQKEGFLARLTSKLRRK